VTVRSAAARLWPWGAVVSLHRAQRFLLRRGVRRSLDGATGLALPGFSARLAAEQA
jgi:hypothetical protein